MNTNTDFSSGKSTSRQVLSPKRVLDLYYLDTRWHLLEIAAMLDRAQRGEAAVPEDASFSASNAGDLRAKLLREALQVLASDSAEPDRTERLLMLFTKMDPKMRENAERNV